MKYIVSVLLIIFLTGCISTYKPLPNVATANVRVVNELSGLKHSLKVLIKNDISDNKPFELGHLGGLSSSKSRLGMLGKTNELKEEHFFEAKVGIDSSVVIGFSGLYSSLFEGASLAGSGCAIPYKFYNLKANHNYEFNFRTENAVCFVELYELLSNGKQIVRKEILEIPHS